MVLLGALRHLHRVPLHSLSYNTPPGVLTALVDRTMRGPSPRDALGVLPATAAADALRESAGGLLYCSGLVGPFAADRGVERLPHERSAAPAEGGVPELAAHGCEFSSLRAS